MSYINQIQIQAADSPSIDAFARLRTSNPTTLFDSKQLYDTGSLFWNTKIVGNATASYFAAGAAVSMSAVGNASSVSRQTKRYFQYQPLKSHLIVTTGNFNGVVANTIKRIGYYDDNNGIFFQTSGSQFGTVIRKNGVDTFTSQSAWNLDIFNGNGTSGKSIDVSKSQIYFFDFEWLGVGRVRYGIFQAGVPTYVHQIANVNSLSDVYMSNPNLPVKYEIINSGSGAQSMLHICSAVASEGGSESTGQTRTVGINSINGAIAANVANTDFGIVAIRLKPTALNGTAFVRKISALNVTGAQNWVYSLIMNPTTGSAYTWTDIPDSICQVATGQVQVSGGTRILGGYVSSTSDASDTLTPQLSLGLGSDVNGNPDIMVLAVQCNANNQNFVGNITFQEQT